MSERRTRIHKSHVLPVGAVDASTSTSPDEPVGTPPAKRRKAKKEPTRAVNSRSRKAGRLSALPALPLDVLYEIFGHLEPLDLLNLARTTKPFRTVLLSRQSHFLWKSVLDAFEAAHELHFPCPEDVSVPVWVNLVYGGAYCDTCGARAQKIVWPLRRRLCKGCSKTVLISYENAFEMLPTCMEVLEFINALPHDCQNNGIYFLRADVETLAAEIASLPVSLPAFTTSERTEWKTAIDAIFAPKIEVWNARREHSRNCEINASVKGMMRGQELDLLREARFMEVRKRLIAMGYDERDAGAPEIRGHKEVYQPKTLTQRVWTRIAPILREVVEETRDERLEVARLHRQHRRNKLVNKGYEDLLVIYVPPSSLSLMPTLSTFRAIPQIAAYIKEDIEKEEESEDEYLAVMTGSAQTIREWAMGRRASLRSLLPNTWPLSSFSLSDVDNFWPEAPPDDDPSPLDIFAKVASLDLAVYAFKCTRPDCQRANYRVLFGIDALAHQCHHDATELNLQILPDLTAHTAVLAILKLLDLDPARTRPVDLDKMESIITTQAGDLDSRPLMTWRQAVEAWVAAPTTLQLATELERTYVKLMGEVPTAERVRKVEDEYVWGCARCSDFLKDLDRVVPHFATAMRLSGVREHANAKHNIRPQDAVEGRDYFHYRRTARHSRHVYTSVPDLEARVAFLQASRRGEGV